MTVALVALSCGLVAFAFVLGAATKRDTIAWIPLVTVLVAALGTMLSAAFRTGASDISETIHSRSSAIAVIALVVLGLLYSFPLARPRADRRL